MEQKLKKKKKQLEYGTKEWKKAVLLVAKMLDEIDKFFWVIGRIAVKIPLSLNGWESPVKKGLLEFTPLQKFAIDIQKQTKRYKNWQSCYERISQARALCQEYEPNEVHEELPINHHVIAVKLSPDKREREKWLSRAEEEGWSAREMAEEMAPERMKVEFTSVEEAYKQFINSLTDLEEAMELLEKHKLKGLSQTRINGMGRSLFVFIRSHLPRFLILLEEEGAKIEPLFKKIIK